MKALTCVIPMLILYSSAAAMTSWSLTDPPGCITELTPAAPRRSMLSRNGKKPSEAQPPIATIEANELRGERDALRAQVARLEENARKEAAEKNRLQDLVRILENRLNLGANPNSGSDAKQDK